MTEDPGEPWLPAHCLSNQTSSSLKTRIPSEPSPVLTRPLVPTAKPKACDSRSHSGLPWGPACAIGWTSEQVMATLPRAEIQGLGFQSHVSDQGQDPAPFSSQQRKSCPAQEFRQARVSSPGTRNPGLNRTCTPQPFPSLPRFYPSHVFHSRRQVPFQPRPQVLPKLQLPFSFPLHPSLGGIAARLCPRGSSAPGG